MSEQVSKSLDHLKIQNEMVLFEAPGLIRLFLVNYVNGVKLTETTICHATDRSHQFESEREDIRDIFHGRKALDELRWEDHTP